MTSGEKKLVTFRDVMFICGGKCPDGFCWDCKASVEGQFDTICAPENCPYWKELEDPND
jgi:hypothetical protein